MILTVSREGLEDVDITATADGMWWVEDTLGKPWDKCSDWAVRLCLAYYELHGRPEQPGDVKAVRAWGREQGIQVLVRDPNPSRQARSGGPA